MGELIVSLMQIVAGLNLFDRCANGRGLYTSVVI